ncbi:MAG: RIP metalloprotease RseP, partial [Clostridia bacterium]|nr:RIP metalloprotease RseP [Clostridia bacterium]
PLCNILFAIVALFLLFAFTGYSKNTDTVMIENLPAYENGLRDGDKILSIDGKKVLDPLDMTVLIYGNEGEPVKVSYERDNQVFTKEITPFKDGGLSYLINFQAVGDTLEVAAISENSDAYIKGIRVGDVITAVNDQKIDNRLQLKEFMDKNKEKDVKITYMRDNTSYDVTITPYVSDQIEYYNLGIYYDYSNVNLFEALKYSVDFSLATVRSIYYSILWLITGVVSLKEIMGPVGIVSTIGDTVKQDTFKLVIMSLVNMMAFISLNLGLMNLLPIPALDGSKIIIYGIEGIRGKKFNVQRTAIVSFIGFACLLVLLLVTTFNDIVRIFGW